MKTRTYPYKAWTVLSSGKPVEVELVRHYWGNWDRAENGKRYDSTKLQQTDALAVTAAHEALDARQERLDKQQYALDKRRAALEKARIEE